MPTTKSAPKKRTSTVNASATKSKRQISTVTKAKAQTNAQPKSQTKSQPKAERKTKRTKARKTPVQARDVSKRPRSSSIVETSPLTWSLSKVGPTFDQIQLSAYHSWLQNGGTEFDNWVAAESELKRKSSGGSNGN